MAVNGVRFIPKRGLFSENLNNVGLENGLFIISLDDKKIYTDAIIDGTLQRVPLGGDISTAIITWSMITGKPFSLLAENDFTIEDDTLSISDNVKFSNRSTLSNITIDSENNNILYETYPMITETYNTNIYESPSQQDVNDIILQVWGS